MSRRYEASEGQNPSSYLGRCEGKNISGQELLDLAGLFSADSLAIIGSEKNAGKTTTLNHLIQAARETDYPRPLALTSIGRDGEGEDVVTGGQKPRIYISSGSYILTGQKSLAAADALLDIRALTGVRDAMGEIVLAQALSDGFVELVGPSRAQDLNVCEQVLREEEPQSFYIVDGALSRQSSAANDLTDGLIYALSAGEAHNPQELLRKARHLLGLLRVPAVSVETRDLVKVVLRELQQVSDAPLAALSLNRGEPALALYQETLLGQPNLLLDLVTDNTYLVYLTGALTDSLLQALLRTDLAAGSKLVVEDGSKLFLSPASLERLRVREIELCALNALDVRFISYNPRGRYGHLLADPALLWELEAQLSLPVLDLGPALNVRPLAES
ncbi:MAG: hypothetical protein Q4E09_05185 [Eubacteriales bacterium]|nr:hypothetical protein [Eubacteriales bacterium]